MIHVDLNKLEVSWLLSACEDRIVALKKSKDLLPSEQAMAITAWKAIQDKLLSTKQV